MMHPAQKLALAATLAALAGMPAYAATMTYSGTFTADNQVYSLSLTPTSTTSYTFATTSFATGGFYPVLTLFNTTSGAYISSSDYSGTGSDALLMASLAAGSYTLDLTQFPNTTNGTLGSGFLFDGASNAAFTGDLCGQTGGKFLNSGTTPCTQRTGAYSLNVTSAAPVPEPATWALLLPGAAMGVVLLRRELL